MDNKQTLNSIKIYDTAKSLLGLPLSPDNSFLGCALTVNFIVKKALGNPAGGDASTMEMYYCLRNSSAFLQVLDPLAGDIIISPTGFGNGFLAHGHVGIVGLYGILSNNSEDGLLEEKFTLDSWRKLYKDLGGFPIEFYRAI